MVGRRPGGGVKVISRPRMPGTWERTPEMGRNMDACPAGDGVGFSVRKKGAHVLKRLMSMGSIVPAYSCTWFALVLRGVWCSGVWVGVLEHVTWRA